MLVRALLRPDYRAHLLHPDQEGFPSINGAEEYELL